MPTPRFLRQFAIRFLKQAQALSQAAAVAVKRWPRQRALGAMEAERLDRIRNPSKYLGKS
jgi:hypothetical protein